MTITRYGAGETGPGGQRLPFARAAGADGWLFVSGQVPTVDGEVVSGGFAAEAHQAIRNMIAVLDEAGYGVEHIVRIGVWLDDTRDFWAFNKIYAGYFTDHPPARACVQSSMMVACKIEIDCVAYKR